MTVTIAPPPPSIPVPVAPATLLVFADDWGRHPSSAQHLIRRLLGRHRVVWVNTVGMRPPRLDLVTVRRGLQKISQWILPSSPPANVAERPTEAGPHVLNPRMWPWMRRKWERAWNARLVARQLTPVLKAESGPIIAVTTLPISADLIGRLPVDRWVYYCVDDFASWPGLDRQPLLDLEAELLHKVDSVIAVSTVLMQRLQASGSVPAFLPHGVDLEHWQSVSNPPADGPDLTEKSQPRCLFWGLVDRRLDPAFLGALDRELEGGSILLLGPTDQPPLDPQWQRVSLLPACSYAALPAVARQADVLIMPYVDAQVTRAMQPLKLLEYLATDRPVVVRDLPANREWADCLDLAATPADFARLVRLRAATGLPPEQAAARAARLPAESWTGRADRFEQLLCQPLTVGGAP